MATQHGGLYSEIGKLVLNAHRGDAIDLHAKAEELASRYPALGLSAQSIANAIVRSSGAVGISLALVAEGVMRREAEAAPREPGYAVLPSGLRVAMLS